MSEKLVPSSMDELAEAVAARTLERMVMAEARVKKLENAAADMRERAAKYMEMRADLIEGEDSNMTDRMIARIYREEADNLRALPLDTDND